MSAEEFRNTEAKSGNSVTKEARSAGGTVTEIRRNLKYSDLNLNSEKEIHLPANGTSIFTWRSLPNKTRWGTKGTSSPSLSTSRV